MSWPITPQGDIKLLRQIPLDRQHTNTVDFTDAAAQAAAMTVYAKYTLSHYTYLGDGRMRVNKCRDDLIMCNYLMYRNTGFGTKWFYAFITDLKYVNNNTTEIIFELDNFQTYMFDYQLQRCFVEREHAVTDAIGENLVAENLELGEYVQDALTPFTNISNPAYIVTTTDYFVYGGATDAWLDYTSAMGAGVFLDTPMGEKCGLHTYIFMNYVLSGVTYTGESQLNFFLSELNRLGKGNSIVSINIVPAQFISVYQPITLLEHTETIVRGIIPVDYVASQFNVEIHVDFGSFSWKNKTYSPKNNKLHTYPYKMLYMTTLDGQAKEYRWEFFNSTPNVYFWWRGTIGTEAALIAAPINYKETGTNYDEKIVLTNFPNISCSSDAWQAYLAQNANKNALTNLTAGITIAGGALGVAVGIATANPTVVAGGFAGIYGGATTIAKLNAQIKDAKVQPDNAHGAQSVPALYTVGLKNIYYTNKRITPEYAEIIDNYFTMFGYATHRVKLPNTNSRPYWNYVKTVDCNLIATSSVDDSTGLDASAAADIRAIYDRGVTIWHSLAAVGHYEYNNAPSA